MKSTLSDSELLLKIAKLTNQVESQTEEEIKEIKINIGLINRTHTLQM